jgi:chorismate mutase
MPAREAHTYPPFIRRMIRGYARQVAQADPEDLAAMVALRQDLDAAIASAVQGVRERHSWADIAVALGMTRQAAQQRWGK